MSPKPQRQTNAFTLKADGITHRLIWTVHVFPAFEPGQAQVLPNGGQYQSIWDTGATNTSINRKVVEECGLIQIGIERVRTASEVIDAPTFLINIGLPNGFMVVGVPAAQLPLAHNLDVLIGMDVITTGDFALSNYQGKTVMTFRSPSVEVIDFVDQALPSRNAQCPCGSGKKYKRCCGRNK
ncbi:MAG: SEC-C metal-binding domain-containing protein [Pseudomonadota bacterium]